jgi:hypothetical protein
MRGVASEQAQARTHSRQAGRHIFPLTLLALASCGSSSLILKPPLMVGCQKAGLPKCPELADGVIEYVDGDKEKAEATIRGAVVGASPDKVQLLIKALKELDSLPGSDKFMGPMHDVIAILTGKSPAATRETPGLTANEPGVSLTSSVDASGQASPWTRLRASTARIVGNSQTTTCTALSYAGAAASISSLCLRATIGPIIITDLEWSQGCPAETFALAGNPDQPIWYFRSDEGRSFAMHGAAFIVPDDTQFVVGHRLTSSSPLPTASCGVTWAGRRP